MSHIETKCKVRAFVGNDQLHEALQGADVVVIPGINWLIRIQSSINNKFKLKLVYHVNPVWQEMIYST